MARAFPDHPFLTGNYGPVRMEAEALDLEIVGEIPASLSGMLYRNGPNPAYAPRGDYHWFLGDGMVHGFEINDGTVNYRNKWVRTEKFKIERKHGEALLSGDFNNLGDRDPRAGNVGLNAANTSIIYHGGKLLALEEVNPPVELDPDTLETIGPWLFDGQYSGPMTAHPRIDPKTGEMIFFAYFGGFPGEPKVGLHWVNKDGALTRSEVIEVPYCAMIHDFLITENYIVLPIFPASIDMNRIAGGGPFVAWDPSLHTHVAIIPREGPLQGKIKWFEADPCYVYHPLNAYETGDGKIICDMMQYERAALFDEDGGNTEMLEDNESRLIRWTLDLNANTGDFRQEVIGDFSGDFPRVDDRVTGLENRHGFFATKTMKDQTGGPFDTILHRNFATGTDSTWVAPEGQYVAEPVFVPDSADAEEGAGFLLSPIYLQEENRTDLVVLRATDIEAGPIARAKLPVRVPYGFHGNWRQF